MNDKEKLQILELEQRVKDMEYTLNYLKKDIKGWSGIYRLWKVMPWIVKGALFVTALGDIYTTWYYIVQKLNLSALLK